jgi:hypothetical protein
MNENTWHSVTGADYRRLQIMGHLSKIMGGVVAASLLAVSTPCFAASAWWTIKLDQIACIEQTDDPEFTENDEVFFVITVTKPDGSMTVDSFPSDLEITIAEGQLRTMQTVIASGDLQVGETVLVSVGVFENDQSAIAAFLQQLGSDLQPVGQQFCLLDPAGCLTSGVGGLVSAIGTLLGNFGLGSGNPFLGSYSVTLYNAGAGLTANWLPGVGLRELWPGMIHFQDVPYAGWYFSNYSDGDYWATFLLEFGPH